MAWCIDIKAGKTITINGAAMTFSNNVTLFLHTQSHVILPNGKVVEPKKDV